MKSSIGSSGRYRRLAEFWKRSAFASGRNSRGAVGVTVGLQTFEAFPGVMQNRCARIHLQRRVRLDATVGPAFTLGPVMWAILSEKT